MKGVNLEKRFYECLGVKRFEKIMIGIGRAVSKLGNKESNSNGDNSYNLSEVELDMRVSNLLNKESNPNSGNSSLEGGNGIEDLRNFKELFMSCTLNHITFLAINALFIIAMPTMLMIVLQGICAIIHIYCIMLQRYNGIRVNELLKEYKRKLNPEEPSERSQNEENGLSQQKGIDNQVKRSYQADTLERERDELKNLREFAFLVDPANTQAPNVDNKDQEHRVLTKKNSWV